MELSAFLFNFALEIKKTAQFDTTFKNISYLCSVNIQTIKNSNMETVKRKRTREEVRAAVRETIRRKKEWIEQTNKEFEMIRNGELKLRYS